MKFKIMVAKLKIPVFFVAAMLSHFVMAQNALTSALNMMRDSDVVEKQQLKFIDPGVNGKHLIWNFKDAKVTNKEYTVRYMRASDGKLYEIEPELIRTYRLENDSLFMTSYQNPLTFLNYTSSILTMKFPLEYGGSYSFPFNGGGKYCGKNAIALSGNTNVSIDAEGIIICSENDTLHNVIRVHELRNSSMRMSKDTVMSYSISKIVEIEDIYKWYARGYRYPVFETHTFSYFQNANMIKTMQTAFRCLPDRQKMLNDTANKKITIQDSINGNSNRQDIIRFEVENNSNVVTLKYSLTQKAKVFAMISGVMGEVYRKISRTDNAGKDYTLVLDCNGLRWGDYILYINVNGNVYSRKVSVK